jgi:hypothetical protein
VRPPDDKEQWPGIIEVQGTVHYYASGSSERPSYFKHEIATRVVEASDGDVAAYRMDDKLFRFYITALELTVLYAAALL